MADEDQEEGIALDAGMPVVGLDGDDLGTLGSVLVDEDTDEPGFIIVKADATERLVPFEAIVEVDEGLLYLDVDPEDFSQFPKVESDRDPTQAEIDMAYRVLGYEEEDLVD